MGLFGSPIIKTILPVDPSMEQLVAIDQIKAVQKRSFSTFDCFVGVNENTSADLTDPIQN
jgi:hypothetical protein